MVGPRDFRASHAILGQQAQARLPLLDGLRGIAAIGVLGYHAEFMFRVGGLFSRAYLLVDFFFLLSGFVLGLSFEARMRNRTLGPVTFMARRWNRLWPVLATGAVIGFVAGLPVYGIGLTSAYLAFALLMVPWPFGGQLIFPLNGPQWSLCWELVANLAHVLLLWRLRERTLWALVAASGAALAAVILLRGGPNMFGMSPTNWYLGIFRIGFAYSFGVALARTWQRGGLPRLGGLAWLAAIALPVGLLALHDMLPVPYAMGDAAMTVLVLPMLFVLAVRAHLPRVLEPACAALGRLSYPLYATHVPIFALVQLQMGQTPEARICAICIAISSAMFIGMLLEPGATRRRAEVAAQPAFA